MGIRASELLATIAFMTDMSPDSIHLHSWRVGLLSEKIASLILPEHVDEVFYAGLLHDIGNVGAYKHMTQYASIREQINDPYVCSHPTRAAGFLESLPGMTTIANFVKVHHERIDGTGYPYGATSAVIPLGGQIVALADKIDIAGTFSSFHNLKLCLANLASQTGQAWTPSLWTSFINSTSDTDFYRGLIDQSCMRDMVYSKLQERKVPSQIDNEAGVERIFHLVAALVDLKDPSTAGHSIRVARYAKDVSKEMGLTEEEISTAYRAGLVHDSGRLGIPTLILNKPGRLSDRELAIVRKHASLTMQALNSFPESKELTNLAYIASHDHERYDGTGYPDRMLGENIPIISRILGAVDAYDAMVSATSYRLVTPRAAILRLEQGANTQFDPAVVKHMTKAVYNEESRMAA